MTITIQPMNEIYPFWEDFIQKLAFEFREKLLKEIDVKIQSAKGERNVHKLNAEKTKLEDFNASSE